MKKKYTQTLLSRKQCRWTCILGSTMRDIVLFFESGSFQIVALKAEVGGFMEVSHTESWVG